MTVGQCCRHQHSIDSRPIRSLVIAFSPPALCESVFEIKLPRGSVIRGDFQKGPVRRGVAHPFTHQRIGETLALMGGMHGERQQLRLIRDGLDQRKRL